MPQRAFIAKVDISDSLVVDEVVSTIWDALEDAGFTVLSVDPWKTQEEIAEQTSSLLGNTSLQVQPVEQGDLGVPPLSSEGGLGI